MKKKISLSIVSLLFMSGFLITGSTLAYYYPPSHVPPGTPPNYNQVDTTHFLGSPTLPLPPPDSGGVFIYYDQGTWNIANHIYSKGNSLEQFHCCVLAELSQPPAVGVNVFIEEFELWGDANNVQCLKQNDRWGWVPWGDGLYEIWWDVTTRKWKGGQGDPNDFMRFRIVGCALDFNVWSSGHGGPFGTDQIFLGANKTPLSSVPGFTDTYPGITDPYQSQAGSDPTGDPNITIFTWKTDTLRSYNKLGLVDSTDSYSCNLALQYGQRYAGSFAYEGDGVEFSTAPLCLPNHDPSILITTDTTVFACYDDSVRLWIFASDPDEGDTITVEKVYGVGVYDPVTDLAPISDGFSFLPDTAGTYMFVFRVTDDEGATNEDTSLVTVILNQAPQLTCPEDDSVHAPGTYVSTDFSAIDPDADPVTVTFLDINPAASYTPAIVGNHVEWLTTCAEHGDYVIRLAATDSCGLADTCGFTVRVYDNPPEITCPDDDSVHAGDTFISTYFSVYDPDGDPPSVWFLGIDPGATNVPTIVDSHVVWVTTCAEDGDYVITLVATAGCFPQDTCQFTVTVYNQPPDLICPDGDSVDAGELFTSGDYWVTDPDDSTEVTVTLHSVSPAPTYQPTLVDSHVEWATTCDDLVNGPDFTFTLIATDPCGEADTCEFVVTVCNLPPGITCPDDDSVHAGAYFVSSDFSHTDPRAEPVTVALCGVDPDPVNEPTIVDNHVEWQTDCADDGLFTICLEATDSCGARDTCYFQVMVYNPPPEITCPDDAPVQASDYFVSTDFSYSDPEGQPVTVALCGVDPTPTNPPVIVDNHIEWQTDCDDANWIFTFCLEATDSCGAKDTCDFTVVVISIPPGISCPGDLSVHAGDTAVSGDYSAIHPPLDFPFTVDILDITPPATNEPTLVDSHVVWVTTCDESGDYFIRLIASDPCGASDTCGFTVSVYNEPPDLTCPLDDSVDAGELFTSGDYWITDPDDSTEVTVTLHSISPAPTYQPTLVDSHVEWATTCDDLINGPNFTITLIATDPCRATDTCEFVVTVYNLPPEIACPQDGSAHAGDLFVSSDFSVSDPKAEPVTVALCGIDPAPVTQPTIVGNHVEWQTDCADDGIFTICLEATDSCGAKATCEFTVDVDNQAPQLTCPSSGSVEAGNMFQSDDFSASDPDGDAVVVTMEGITPSATNDPVTVGSHVEWLTTTAEEGDYSITLRATDECGRYTECSFLVSVIVVEGRNIVLIGEIDCVDPGDYVSLPVYLVNTEPEFGGFELELEFDYTAMSFVDAERGELLLESYTDQDGVFWSWEYFTYRLLPCQIPPCVKYKVLVYGQAEIPNGSMNRGLCIPENSTDVLLYLNFVVMNNQNLSGFMIPVCFEWEGMVVDNIVVEDWECTENTFSSCDGNTIYTSSLLCEFNPDVCDDPGGYVQRILTFQSPICGLNCGGILVCAAGPGVCKRGDVNMNTLSYEVADAVLFANYFVRGTGVFIHDWDYQTCATDANGDGRTLTLSDLIYLIRVILHDAVEIPKLAPSSEIANVIVYNNTISTECAAPIAAMLFEFDGAVEARVLANMEMIHNGNKVLVWSRNGNSFTAAEVLSFAGAELVSVSAVDYNTREVQTSITAKVAPAAFALHPAYPNPFNPQTQISYYLPRDCQVRLTIYNLLGRRVKTLFDGHQDAGMHTLIWDGRTDGGSQLSSGIYFYRLQADNFLQTRKMTLMK